MLEKELESVYVDITARNGRHVRIGSLYHAPNTDVKPLMDHLEMVSSKTVNKPNHELIIGIDQNLDLLKSEEHAGTRKFLDFDPKLWFVASDYEANKNHTQKCYTN